MIGQQAGISPPETAKENCHSSLPGPVAQAQAAQHDTCLSRMDEWSLLRIQGTDAEIFLQGQISNDIRKLGVENALLAAHSSVRGRMLAIMQLVRRDGTIVLRVHQGVAADLVRRLRMYVVRAQVTIDEIGDEISICGLWGEDATTALAAANLPIPQQPWALCAAGDIQIIRQPGSIARFELYGSVKALQELWPVLGTHARTVDSPGWRLLDVCSGIPTVYPQTSDHFVAQMTNLDQLGAISFDKGCYTGQEVIARLHYLGRLKRRMFRGQACCMPPTPGTPVFAGSSRAGEVVDAVLTDLDQCAVLVVLKVTTASEKALHLTIPEGPLLRLESGEENSTQSG